MDDEAELIALQNTFDVTGLGGGDRIVGFNLLASMACTLANLAPDDGTVILHEGTPARLGISTLVTGSASAGRVVDEIIIEVNKTQGNLLAHLKNYEEWHGKTKRLRAAELPPPGPGVLESVSKVADTQSDFGSIISGHRGSWFMVLESAPNQYQEHLLKQAKFLVSVRQPSDLESQLSRALPGFPLVHLGFSHPNHLALYAETASALLEGRYPLVDGRTIKGNLLVTDSMQALVASSHDPDESSLWLGQLLWLTDGNSGPEAPQQAPQQDPLVKQVSSAEIGRNFQEANKWVITHRFNYPHKQKLKIKTAHRKASLRWTRSLRKMEPQLPGISGAARNLLTSLLFGLEQLAPESKIPLTGVEAMARFLVRRMANARIAISHAGEVARRCDQIERIYRKIIKGPVTERKISSDTKLPAGDRDEALRWLEAAKLAYKQEDKWHIHEGGRLDFKACSVPILEV